MDAVQAFGLVIFGLGVFLVYRHFSQKRRDEKALREADKEHPTK